MLITMLLTQRTLLVSIQSSTAAPGPQVVYRVSRASPTYQMLSKYPLQGTSIPQDVIRSMHRAAVSGLGVTVCYPELQKYAAQIHRETHLQSLEN